jgi:hypothetical protein
MRIGNGFAPGGSYFIDHFFSRTDDGFFYLQIIHPNAEVVDDNLCTFICGSNSDGFTNAPSGPGYDDNFTFQYAHVLNPLY